MGRLPTFLSLPPPLLSSYATPLHLGAAPSHGPLIEIDSVLQPQPEGYGGKGQQTEDAPQSQALGVCEITSRLRNHRDLLVVQMRRWR